VSGTVREGELASGLVEVDSSIAAVGQSLSATDIRIIGQSLRGGGVAMTTSKVTLGTGSNPTLFQGRVDALTGTNIEASVKNAHGAVIRLLARLQINPSTGSAGGTLTAAPR
jgi:hypothetical protein